MITPTNYTSTTLPDQRVSLKTKQSSKWTKSMADYVLSLAFSCNDKTKVSKFLSSGFIHALK